MMTCRGLFREPSQEPTGPSEAPQLIGEDLDPLSFGDLPDTRLMAVLAYEAQNPFPSSSSQRGTGLEPCS